MFALLMLIFVQNRKLLNNFSNPVADRGVAYKKIVHLKIDVEIEIYVFQ